MKPKIILLSAISSLLIFSSCADRPNTCSITIKVPPEAFDSLGYYVSRDQLTAYSSWGFEREYLDSAGMLELTVSTDDISWLFFSFFTNPGYKPVRPDMDRVFLLVQPGKYYSVEYDTTSSVLFRIRGDDQEAQNLFNTLSQHQHSRGNDWLTNSDTRIAQFLIHLEDSIENTVRPFEELYKNGQIDKTYYRAVYNYIEYSHAGGLLHHFYVRRRAHEEPSVFENISEIHPLDITDEDLALLKELVYKRYPVARKEAGLLPGLGEYIDEYIQLKTASENINYSSSKGKLEMVNRASGFIDEELLEMYFAHQFNSMSLLCGPDSMATYLYKAFKERYPDSPFIPGIMRHIENSTEYYSAFYPGLHSDQNDMEATQNTGQIILSPQVQIIRDETIRTMEELLVKFKGKNLLVDFWASWCPPCRYEFRFADTLHQFLAANNIEMLYISTDQDENKWLSTVKSYNLEGNHFRVSNPELRKDMEQIVDFVPTYMIVDSTGKILEYDAERPHTKEILYDQVLTLLKDE